MESGESRVDTTRGASDYYQEPCGDWHKLEPETLRRVIANDHGVIGLKVTVSFIDGLTEDNDYGEESGLVFVDLCAIIGVAIANNRWLQKIDIDAEMIEPDEILPVLQGIASNRSIEHLHLMRLPEVDISEIFAPFFLHNRSLRCIEILWSYMPQRTASFLSAMSECTQLERFELRHNNYGYGWGSDLIPSGPPVDGQVARVIKSLCENHPNILELSLGGRIQNRGCVELASLLRRSASKVVALYLESCDIDDESFAVISVPLVRGIKTFSIFGNGRETISATGWRVFSAALHDTTCKLEVLMIEATDIDDEGAISLGESLAINVTVKSVSLSYSDLITSEGWQRFARCLSNPNIALEELNVRRCHNIDGEVEVGLDDEAANAIGESLAMNTTLKKLDMSHNNNVTSDGWIQFFNVLLHSKCSLEELNVSANYIGDEEAKALVNLLVTMRNFHTLHLRDSDCTANGLRTFTHLLQPSSKVTTLDLGMNDFNDEVINDFANVLANNSTLTALHIGGDELTDSSWAALSHALCDETSIENTYSSNHSLHTLENFGRRNARALRPSFRIVALEQESRQGFSTTSKGSHSPS